MSVNLNEEFYHIIQQRADTEGLSLNAADVSRVLALAGDFLGALPAHKTVALLAKWFEAESD